MQLIQPMNTLILMQANMLLIIELSLSAIVKSIGRFISVGTLDSV